MIVKKVAPKSGEEGSVGGSKGTDPMGWQAKRLQSFVNQVLPLNQVEHDKRHAKKIVARIHLRALSFPPRLDAETPKTMVKLDESRQNVITEEKTMLG